MVGIVLNIMIGFSKNITFMPKMCVCVFLNLFQGRPQTGLQYFRWALQADIQCFPALYHAAMVYRQLEIMEAELEALNHLSVVSPNFVHLHSLPIFQF